MVDILAVRTSGEPMALARQVQAELAAIDPALPLYNATTLRAALDRGLAGKRMPVLLISAFGALALILASVGVYAMFASMAAAREREFGIRVALGASRRAIAKLVRQQGAMWMTLGLVAGAAGAVTAGGLLRSLLYGVGPTDPIALGVAVLLLVACAGIALVGPVRRATRADPVNVMR